MIRSFVRLPYDVPTGRQTTGVGGYSGQGTTWTQEILGIDPSGQVAPKDVCSVLIDSRTAKMADKDAAAVEIKDTDSEPNLAVHLTRDARGWAVLHVVNQADSFKAEITFPLGDASHIDEAYFSPGAFCQVAEKVIAGRSGSDAGFQVGEAEWTLSNGRLVQV
ncbi:MAG: hypothetical protein AB7S38_33085 [Vulcanimicrobiota bacterium]